MTTTAMTSDTELAQRVAAGDSDALAAIYDRYAEQLLSFCHGLLQRQADAEDCLQDIFIIAATRLTGLREPALLRSWLFSVARHECRVRLDRRQREVPMDDIFDTVLSGESAAETPADASTEGELTDLLPDAVAGLPDAVDVQPDAVEGLSDGDRLLLALGEQHELTGDEVAKAIGVSPTAAGSLLAQARADARSSLGTLLVARTGREQCPELDGLLDDWDGRPAALQKKKIKRHIDKCTICGEQRDRVAAPAALLGQGLGHGVGVGGGGGGESPADAADLASLRGPILTAAATAARATVIGLPVAVASDTDWVDGWPPPDPDLADSDDHSRRWGAPVVVLIVLLLAIGATVGLLAVKGTPTPRGANRALAPTSSPTGAPTSTGPASAAPGAILNGSAGGATQPVTQPAPIASVSLASAPPVAARGTTEATASTAPGLLQLTVTTGARGGVSVRAGSTQTDCPGTSTCSYSVASGTRITVSAASALRGGGFTRFTAPASCTNAIESCTFTITADTAVVLRTANFNRGPQNG